MKTSLALPRLQTRRTRMRRVETGDLNALVQLHRDPATRHFAWVDHLQDEDSIRYWLEEQQELYHDGLGIMAIESLQAGDFLGLCGLRVRKDLNHAIDLTYRIMPEKRNMGYASEAAAEMVSYGFYELGLTEIIAQVHKNNFPSRRIMYRLGFGIVPTPGKEKWLLYRKTGQGAFG